MGLGTLAAAHLVRVLPRARISRAVGRLCDVPLPPVVSNGLVAAYTRLFRVDLTEVEPPNGTNGYPCFDAFFTRPLRTGSRPCPAEDHIVASPCDGSVEAIGTVDVAGSITVKGAPYGVADLIGSAEDAERYHGGAYAVVYLAPSDYHRVHSPLAGRIVRVRSLPGDLYPVNRIGQHVPRLLVRNRRIAIDLETDGFGPICVVMVAAMMVGRITVSTMSEWDVPLGTHSMSPPVPVKPGSELGVFHLGSTVVLLTTRQARARWIRGEGPIRAGAALASLEPGAVTGESAPDESVGGTHSDG